MYNYKWDKETGGYILLPTKITGVAKEVRPVYHEELRFLELDKNYGWVIPDSIYPLLWAEGRRYIYKGDVVAESVGGGLYDLPMMKNVIRNLELTPVDIDRFTKKNESILDGLVQKTLKDLYAIFQEYRESVDMAYAAFSGGKDSIVMLDIVQRALPHDSFDVVFGDTTMELSDTYETVKKAQRKWSDLNWYIAKTDFNATESWRTIGPPARTIRWCCGVHKSAPSVMKIKEILAKRRNCELDEIKHFKVLAFLGVRREESEARSTYEMVSEGNKHAVQINCNPILEWNTAELFVYFFSRNLPLNDMYRKGSHRVGCLLCPMAANWYECVVNHNYRDEVKPFIDIIKDSVRKEYVTEEEWKQYFTDGGWKQRSSGKLLKESENKILNISSKNEERFIIKNPNYSWKKWLVTLGDIVEVSSGRFSLQFGEINLIFNVEEKEGLTIITFPPLVKSKSSIRFMYLFKNALNKSAYCKNCKECMAECPNGALTITGEDIIIKNCKHCQKCLDKPKGCIIAKSKTTTGDNNMSVKNIDRYKNFGLRQSWIEIFLEDPTAFWVNDRMGTHMFKSFEKWGKESGLIDQFNSPTGVVEKFAELGADSPVLWGYIYSNIAYNSAIFNWFVRRLEYGVEYQSTDMVIMLGDDYSETTKKNALTALKDTIKSSPIGWLLGQGECQMSGKQVSSITKIGWTDPEPIVVLYTLYLFAEKMDNLYSFTLTDLLDDSNEREGLSPRVIFGIERETLKPILQGLANNYSDYIQVDFNKGIMENIDLPAGKKGKSAIDILSLI